MFNKILHFIGYKSIVLIFFILSGVQMKAQFLPTDSALIKIFDSDNLLPILIDSAIKHSGEIKRIENGILVWKETAEINKKNIWSGVSFLSSYNYGTTGDLTSGKDNISTNPFTTFRTNKGERYNVGVNVQIPLTSLIGRKNQIHVSELQSRMAEGERDNAKLYIKGEVIRMYQEMKLAQRLLLISAKSKQTAFVNYSLAEKSFIKGNGDLDQLSRLHDIFSKASAQFETDINRFQTNYLQVQEYAGVKLYNVILQLK